MKCKPTGHAHGHAVITKADSSSLMPRILASHCWLTQMAASSVTCFSLYNFLMDSLFTAFCEQWKKNVRFFLHFFLSSNLFAMQHSSFGTLLFKNFVLFPLSSQHMMLWKWNTDKSLDFKIHYYNITLLAKLFFCFLNFCALFVYISFRRSRDAALSKQPIKV